MNFFDDEAGVSDEDDILVPSSQNNYIRRPLKRRRLNTVYVNHSREDSGSGSDDYDLPSNDYLNVDASEEDEQVNRSKYEGVMHVPEYAETQKDTFVTQLTQPWSSPTRIRGPRWKKQTTPPTPVSRPKSPASSIAQSRPNLIGQPSNPPLEVRGEATQSPLPISGDEFDDNDPDLLQAFMSSPIEAVEERRVNRVVQVVQAQRPISTSFRQTTLFGMNSTQTDAPTTQAARVHSWPLASKLEPATHHKVDLEAMKTWVYPINLGKTRDYQFNIVHKGLFHNLLVALPTGLGKTFIAATVMLNWFRWTKEAQILFVAPTKPLVSQQIDACFNIVGIPRSQTTMLTGEVSPAVRAEEWQEKRVFFMTPQTLINDLKNGMCDPKKIVLLVVDEAHKATGNYAYVEVIRFLRRFNSSFRVLALTATPGASVETVQKVIDGLDIARVEIRTEDSMDIRDFVHSRNIELEVFDNSDELNMALELFAGAVKPVMKKVNGQNAYWGKDPTMITLFGLKKARDDWSRSETGRKAGWGLKSMINTAFTALMGLAHNLELLKYHGIGPFFHKMKIFEDETARSNKDARQIAEHEQFKKLMSRLQTWCNNPDFVGHPKLSYLKGVVLNHFMDAGDGCGRAGGKAPSDTRIMIFAHYRDSAEEISRVLNQHGDMVRAHVFVGQSGTKGSEGMDQKTQVDIIKKFKAGTYNTLVATSIGEEGLDIGEVDLIVCYDCSKSPIRMLQRMGRTGRKRAGNIILLLMRGKEENDYYKAKDNYQKMQELIESGKDFIFHEDKSPRIIPKDIVPVVDKRIVDIPVENTQADALDLRKRRPRNPKKPQKKFHMPDGVETGFSFLGAGKKGKAQKPAAQPILDTEVAGLPALEGILLTSEEELQLEHRYAQVAGTEPQHVRRVRLEAFPEGLLRLGKTSLVKHSRTTKALVRGMKQTRNPQQDWTRPSEQDIMKVFDVSATLDIERKHCSPHSRRQAREKVLSPGTSGTLESSGAVQPLDEYDMGSSFIDDRPVIVNNDTDSGDGSYASQFQFTERLFGTPKRRRSEIEKPFYVSQQQVDEDDMPEDELPELGDLVARRGNAAGSGRAQPATGLTKRKATRQVLDSDDDDDE